MLAKVTEAFKDICVICERAQENGIYMNQVFICRQCEGRLVQTDVEDPLYQGYVQKLKNANRIKSYQ